MFAKTKWANDDLLLAYRLTGIDPKSGEESKVKEEWDRRSKLEYPEISSRYNAEEFKRASEEFVKFVLNRVGYYATNKSVVEFGCGSGRFTAPLLKLSKSVTAVDASRSMIHKNKKATGDKAIYKASFVEDFNPQNKFNFSFSCLLLIHILDEEGLYKAINNMKNCADVVVICEHTDINAQKKVSDYTKIWPVSLYRDMFKDDFKEIACYRYDFLGDIFELLVFKKIMKNDGLCKDANAILSQVLPKTRLRYPKAWYDLYSLYEFGGMSVPYIRLIGSYLQFDSEFIDEQVMLNYINDEYRLPDNLARDEKQCIQKILASDKYQKFLPVNQVKTRIDNIDCSQFDPSTNNPLTLLLDLKRVTYFNYLIVKEKLKESIDLRRDLTGRKPISITDIKKLKTTNIGGCGVFLITSDNYIILTRREKVTEYSGFVGYSASGAMTWETVAMNKYRADPFHTMIKETQKEVGINLDTKWLRIFAVGIDVQAFFIQFSFCAHVDMRADQILRTWQNAIEHYEQIPFAVPIDPDALSEIIVTYPMEPSAKATLIQLSCKLFGKENFENLIKNKLAIKLKK